MGKPMGEFPRAAVHVHRGREEQVRCQDSNSAVKPEWLSKETVPPDLSVCAWLWQFPLSSCEADFPLKEFCYQLFLLLVMPPTLFDLVFEAQSPGGWGKGNTSLSSRSWGMREVSSNPPVIFSAGDVTVWLTTNPQLLRTHCEHEPLK